MTLVRLIVFYQCKVNAVTVIQSRHPYFNANLIDVLISQTVMAQNVNHNYVAMIIHCHPSLLPPKFSWIIF